MALGKTIRQLGVKISLLFDKRKVQEAQEAITEVSKSLKEVALHVAEASAVMFEWAHITGEHSRSLEENSKQLGINVEKLQELEFAASTVAGVSRDELQGALKSLSNTMFEARNNSADAAKQLFQAGVPLDLLTNNSYTADQALMALADQFKNIQDGAYKAALANKIGGESLVKLLPILSLGAKGFEEAAKKARVMGVVLGKESIEKGVEFEKQFSEVLFVLKNISYLVGNELIQNLTPLIKQFSTFVVQNRKFLALGIATAVKSLGYYLGIVFKVVSALTKSFRWLVDTLGGLERVTTVVAIAMGYLASVKIVSGVLSLIKNFRALGGVIGLITSPIALVSAGMVALFLIIQDWFSDDSLIKEWIEDFSDSFPNATKAMVTVFDSVKTAVNEVSAAISGLWQLFKSLITGSESFGAAMHDAMKPLSKLLDYTPMGMIQKGVGSVVDYFKGGSATTASSQSVSGGAGAKTNNITANFNVGIPPGTSAANATGIVSNGVEDALTRMMKQTVSQTQGGLAY